MNHIVCISNAYFLGKQKREQFFILIVAVRLFFIFPLSMPLFPNSNLLYHNPDTAGFFDGAGGSGKGD